MKCRAWTGEKYLYDGFDLTSDGRPFYYQHYEGRIYPDGWVIEYCTGLKDKNGKDVYQGDIIKDIHTPKHLYKPVIWGGHWNYAAFGTGGKRTGKADWEPDYYWDQLTPEYMAMCEVVGTIHKHFLLEKISD